MIEAAAPELVARSRPKTVALVVLVAVTVFFAYVAMTAFDPSLPAFDFGRRRLGRPSHAVGSFLLACAVLSLAGTVWLFRRRLNPTIAVVADAHGISVDQLFWGRGRLAWSEITELQMRYQSMLYIRGVPQGGDGKTKKLVIDTGGIDVSIGDLVTVIVRHRPDLVERSPG